MIQNIKSYNTYNIYVLIMDGFKSELTTVLYAVIFERQFFNNFINLTVSMAMAKIIVILVEWICKRIATLPFIKSWSSPLKYYIIKTKNPYYDKLIELLYKKYIDKIHGGFLFIKDGNQKTMIDELTTKELTDDFMYENINHKIIIKLISQNSDDTSEVSDKKKSTDKKNDEVPSKTKNICLYAKCNFNILEAYAQYLIGKSMEKDVVDKEELIKRLIIYKPIIENGKDRYMYWSDNITKTNKTIKNTIVSEHVNKYFYEDVRNFIKNEEYHAQKGLSYKRGYLLYGEPGCGKTSIIRAIAAEYNLTMFVVDLNIFNNNNELVKVMNAINSYITGKKRYVLVFEDVDRATVFDKRYYEKKLTEDCLLNILDGLDESYGRITIITTNDLDAVKTIKSLVRPGRIDVTINVTYCTTQQIKDILKLYYNKEFNDVELKPNIIITPAKLIQIMSLIKEEDKVIKMLNKYKDFKTFEVEKHNDELNNDDIVIVGELNKKDEPPKIKKKWWENKLEKQEVRLDKMRKDINRINHGIEDNDEKYKLMLEKKKIDLKLLEIEHQNYKIYCADKNNVKKTTQEIEDEIAFDNVKVSEPIIL
jgi:SpoVK/Ycf46/Vps4 family AAA+-type ATPase